MGKEGGVNSPRFLALQVHFHLKLSTAGICSPAGLQRASREGSLKLFVALQKFLEI